MAESTGRFVKGWFYHGVKLSKWENTNQAGRVNVSFSIEKSYKDKTTQEYKKSTTFFSDDLDALLQVLLAAKRESIKEIFPKAQGQQSESASVAETFAGYENVQYDPDVPF